MVIWYACFLLLYSITFSLSLSVIFSCMFSMFYVFHVFVYFFSLFLTMDHVSEIKIWWWWKVNTHIAVMQLGVSVTCILDQIVLPDTWQRLHSHLYLSQLRLSWPSWLGYILRRYNHLKTVTYPGTNWAEYRVTSYMRSMTLPLHQTTNLSSSSELIGSAQLL